MLLGPLAPLFTDDSPLSVGEQVPAVPSASQEKIPSSVAPDKVAEPKSSNSSGQPSVPPKRKPLPPLGLSLKRGKAAPASTVTETEHKVVEVEEQQFVLQKDLEKYWHLFAAGQENFAQQTLMTVKPVLKDETVIFIMLENFFQQQKMNELMQTILPYLRKSLSNNKLVIDMQLTEELASTRAFTPRERLEQLVKENASLHKLIDVLGLDVE